jgi:hypoxanthine phosphoribosyltransferase
MPAPSKPRVFVASSREGLPVARMVQQHLSHDALVTVWTDNVFNPSDYAFESLERQLDAADCALFIMTPDDMVKTRGNAARAPRDNVVLELGLFAGRLGRRRAIAMVPRNWPVKLPSDLLGINPVGYEHYEDKSLLPAALGAACNEIRLYLEGLSLQPKHLSWEELCGLTAGLAGMLRRSAHGGGYSFDVLVGLSRGGVAVADQLSRIFGGNVPVICLWADRHSNYPDTTFAPPDNWINEHVVHILQDNRVRNVLVVDDVTRRGHTLVQARDWLSDSLPGKRVKSAILLAPPSARRKIDFISRVVDTTEIQTPFAIVDM